MNMHKTKMSGLSCMRSHFVPPARLWPYCCAGVPVWAAGPRTPAQPCAAEEHPEWWHSTVNHSQLAYLTCSALYQSETNWILSNVSVRVLFYRHVEFGGMQDLPSLPAGCEPPVWTSIAPSGCKYNIKNKITLVTLQHRLVIKNTELDKTST